MRHRAGGEVDPVDRKHVVEAVEDRRGGVGVGHVEVDGAADGDAHAAHAACAACAGSRCGPADARDEAQNSRRLQQRNPVGDVDPSHRNTRERAVIVLATGHVVGARELLHHVARGQGGRRREGEHGRENDPETFHNLFCNNEIVILLPLLHEQVFAGDQVVRSHRPRRESSTSRSELFFRLAGTQSLRDSFFS